MDKKGMELSINFVVMLILAIVVFAFGLVFVRNLFQQAGAIKAQLDADTEKNIQTLLDRGEPVAFPITSKDAHAGETAVFGLGVLNVNTKTTFEVDIKCNVAIDAKDAPIQNGCDGAWTFDYNSATATVFELQPFDLEKNQQKVIPIAIQVPGVKQRGTYGFTVTVKDKITGQLYGGAPKQIYVNVI